MAGRVGKAGAAAPGLWYRWAAMLLALQLVACSDDTVTRTSRPGRPDLHADDTADTGADDTGNGGSSGGGGGGGSGGGGGGAGGGDTEDTAPDDPNAKLYGVDVSGWDPGINWHKVAAGGISFAIAKATEGDYYTSDEFTSQYQGAYGAGLIRGAYHFANPSSTGGAEQADFFVDNGGDWSDDGWTLPGALDIEYNPYDGDTCYDLSKADMKAWVHDFDDEYVALTGRHPLIYSTADWWDTCVGTGGFSDNGLWVANYGVSSPSLPTGWSDYTFWQYTSTASISGIDGDADESVFRGDEGDLVDFAVGS